MDLVTAVQMREMDRRATAGGIPGLVLMERAGRGLLRSLLARKPELHARRVAIVCGGGNNGGDGLVLARLLRERGIWPDLLLAAPPDSLKGDAAENGRRAAACGFSLRQAGEGERTRLAHLSAHDLVVDALLGTGISGPARGDAEAWIHAMNAGPAPVVAVDIPSGLSADTGEVAGAAVAAAWTVTMGMPKLGFFFPPARALVGEVDIVDLGFPTSVIEEVGVSARLPEAATLADWLPSPGSGSQKGDWGKLLVVGGSPGLTGALALAAGAALRTGSGLVRVGLPRSLNPILAAKLTSAMTIPLPEGEDGQLVRTAADEILGRFGDWDALVLGPGLGRFPECERLVMSLLGRWRGPLLLDADALNALASWGADSWVPRVRELRASGRPGGAVLTPHLGEMSRLTGRSIPDLRADPVETARTWAERWGVTLVLKGAPSVTAGPDGRVWVNPTGNAGLATGGSGDVLAGIIGALLAQRLPGPEAAVVGCYLHGLAADLAVRRREAEPGAVDGSGRSRPVHCARSTRPWAQRSLLPDDVTNWLPLALGLLERGQDPPGLRWKRIR
jgi:ADP-dependent NAD(P)H-hydrate dehydratase / NAD(P)H-hydrate epimerase